MAVIPLPAFARFDDVEWIPRFKSQVNTSAWSGNRKVMGLPGGESFAVRASPRPAMTESAERLWRSFIVRLRGVENKFQMPFACNQFPGGTADPVVSSATAGNGFASLSGIPAGGMKAGMGMTFNLTGGTKQLVIVTLDTSAGAATVYFEPSLRKNATAVVANNPYAEVAMTKDNTGWSLAQGRFMVGFDAEEVWA